MKQNPTVWIREFALLCGKKDWGSGREKLGSVKAWAKLWGSKNTPARIRA
jgi:hypothetical protein